MTPLRNIAHEAFLDLWRRPWRSALLTATVAATLVIVSITAEAGDASARQLADQLTTLEARTVNVRSSGSGAIPATALPPPGTSGVEMAIALGPNEDVRLSTIVSRPPVALREIAGAGLDVSLVDAALAAPEAMAQLGLMRGSSGAVVTADGREYLVVPIEQLPAGLDPAQLWVPVAEVAKPAELRIVVDDIVKAPMVEALTGSLLADVDPGTVVMERPSSRLGDYRLVVADAARRRQVITRASFVVVAVVIASLVLADVTGRRRDFGRKRAMGASRAAVAATVLLHVGTLTTGGLALGGALTALIAAAVGGYWSLDHHRLLWLSLGMGGLAIMASIAPAVLASLRDPVHELRVP